MRKWMSPIAVAVLGLDGQGLPLNTLESHCVYPPTTHADCSAYTRTSSIGDNDFVRIATGDYSVTNKCRGCFSSNLSIVLDFGPTPLANALPSVRDEDELFFPMTLKRCNDCTLLQIIETVDPERLFSHYLYFSSFSETMLEHARQYCNEMQARLGLNNESFVVEIASNDGYLLKNFVETGVSVLGVEPAKNIAEHANEQGIPTRNDFFNSSVARDIAKTRRADLIIGNNVLAHVAELHDFLTGVHTLLKENGVATFEFPYAIEMIDRNEFDTVYHEHLCFYSLTAVRSLMARNGLEVFDVERLPIHGGSLRVFTCQASSRPIQPAVLKMLEDESAWGVATERPYAAFASRVLHLKAHLTELLKTLKMQGKTIAAYGASAKGAILTNLFGIDRNLIDFVVDRSHHKQGRYLPGTGIPIQPTEALLERCPDYVLLLTWNFADEILAQQKAYRDRGGTFIIPVPEIRMV